MVTQRKPPDEKEFILQVEALVERFGGAAFCASSGTYPEYTLFMEDQTVIAEPKGAPRHLYGLFCRVHVGLSEGAMAEQVLQWLSSGEAYQEFLAMNVFRYNG